MFAQLIAALSKPRFVFPAAVVLRAVLLLYGLFQDAYTPFKYTDIDYFVFTDAARYLSRGQSPYKRDTYRYTPILAWLLLPTARGGWWFSFGKVLFAAGDIIAGWLTIAILKRHYGMPVDRATRFACIWLLNPMVATISTRGSSEGLVGVTVLAMLYAILERRTAVASILLGFAVHFKIYPFIYATSFIWWLHSEKQVPSSSASVGRRIAAFCNYDRLVLAFGSFATFMSLNLSMFKMYGPAYLEHSWTYHFTRLDHRHNFSPYNTLLYLNSSPATNSTIRIESLAFVPQLILSAFVIPLALAKRDIGSTMLAQTLAFVAFNKICTSQYFLWYMVFLPFYLPRSRLIGRPAVGLTVAFLWVAGQAAWLQQGYSLEFLGLSTFFPGLWLSSIAFFLINCWALGIVIEDIGSRASPRVMDKSSKDR